MTLYSDPNSAQSHRVRIVLGEKDLIFNVEDIISSQNNEDLIALNPNNTTPTFVDRNLVLYESRVIMEYLDERFPHPPLMPVDPVIRAKTRMVLHYIEKDLYGLLDDIKSSGEKKSSAAKLKLKENLMLSLDFIQGKKFFLSDDFSIIDCSMAPILWRLPEYGIELPKSAKPILKYADKLFERTSFVENLSEQEEEMRSIY
ncbi:glutathione S-transferase N-terminal domain-containing protein [Gammaproteobacteria bacterium]|nr:glutathione S-transferase N-terminal domain-containing protein [Gammaproteobacteria bacterium]MDC0482303.1 glutathione S-transferase N-terminal domain-containing protein [Gammaproteobacteria bacterium]